MRNWWQSILERSVQIKGYGENIPHDYFVVILLVLVSIASFGLGRLSVLDTVKTPMTLLQAPLSEIRPMYIGGEIVASRKGSKYHFPWCSGALTMKESNKIWFKSVEAARAAGYAPAGNCKGLE